MTGMYVLGRVLGEYLIAKDLRGQIEEELNKEEESERKGRVKRIGDEEYVWVDGKWVRKSGIDKEILGKLDTRGLRSLWTQFATRRKLSEDELLKLEDEAGRKEEVKKILRDKIPEVLSRGTLTERDIPLISVALQMNDPEMLRKIFDVASSRKGPKEGGAIIDPNIAEKKERERAKENFIRKVEKISKGDREILNEFAKKYGYGSWLNLVGEIEEKLPSASFLNQLLKEIEVYVKQMEKEKEKKLKEEIKKYEGEMSVMPEGGMSEIPFISKRR